jgi:hypothetical protein
MKKACIATIVPLLFIWTAVITPGQAAQPQESSGYVLEVTYFKGSSLAFQTLVQNSLYGSFKPLPNWKPAPGEVPVQGVSLRPRQENGVVTIKVVVVRGDYLDKEDFVAEYVISERTTVLEGLASVGIVPFEVKLVRAPSTVASLPTVENKTSSLIVSVEPTSSALPSFKVRVINASAKPVAALAFQTTIKGSAQNIGTPWNHDGGDLIAPGAAYEMTLRYPTKRVTETAGELPETRSGLQLEVLAVVFADGSYEGDAAPSARFRGRKLGEKIQLSRMVALLRSPAAAASETLATKADELSYRIDLAEVKVIAPEFPELPSDEWENVRSSAELSAHNFQKEFKSTFGKGSTIPPAIFAEAVRSVLSRCEARINSLP